MQLIVRGSPQDAMNAAVKRDIAFVPLEFLTNGSCHGYCPMADADKVLAWYAENGRGPVITFEHKRGTLLSYAWPEEN